MFNIKKFVKIIDKLLFKLNSSIIINLEKLFLRFFNHLLLIIHIS